MQQVVYVANPVSGLIHVFRLEAGTLAPLQEVQTGGEVQPLVISPDRRWLHAGVRPDCRVLSFPISADGRLGARPRRRCSAAPPTPARTTAAASSLPPPTPSTTSPSPARIRRAGCSPLTSVSTT
ncbi:beta-propeller fold lactonase family protein [Aeromonas caviae]